MDPCAPLTQQVEETALAHVGGAGDDCMDPPAKQLTPAPVLQVGTDLLLQRPHGGIHCRERVSETEQGGTAGTKCPGPPRCPASLTSGQNLFLHIVILTEVDIGFKVGESLQTGAGVSGDIPAPCP